MYKPETHSVTAYFDKDPKSIDGRFTLQIVERSTGKVVEKIAKLPASSGQRSGIGQDWLRGKSGIPFCKQRENGTYIPFVLWLRRTKQFGQHPQSRGIGEFYPISSGLDNSRVIKDPNGTSQERWDIGLHGNNAIAGSAGCVVLELDHKVRYQNVLRLRAKLIELSKSFEYIDLIVL